MADITYHVNLRDETTAIFLIGDMYEASLLQASTMTNVHENGLSQFVQRTTLYNVNPTNIVENILQPRPVNLRPILGPAPTATTLTVYKIHLDAYTSVANDIRTIAQHIISGLSPSATTALNAYATNNPTILRHPWQLWDYLFNIYGNYTEQQIQLIRDKLNTPISDTETLASHAVMFKQNILFLERIRQPLSAVDQMAAYSKSLSGNSQYQQAITLYKSSQALADRTLTQMTIFVETQAPNMPTQSSTLGYSAAAAAPSFTRSANKQRVHTNTERSTRPSGALTYCYVHGYGGHNGTKCREMLKDPKAYEHKHFIATSHTAVEGGSTWNK
jgi:hypothetical protein